MVSYTCSMLSTSSVCALIICADWFNFSNIASILLSSSINSTWRQSYHTCIIGASNLRLPENPSAPAYFPSSCISNRLFRSSSCPRLLSSYAVAAVAEETSPCFVNKADLRQSVLDISRLAAQQRTKLLGWARKKGVMQDKPNVNAQYRGLCWSPG